MDCFELRYDRHFTGSLIVVDCLIATGWPFEGSDTVLCQQVSFGFVFPNIYQLQNPKIHSRPQKQMGSSEFPQPGPFLAGFSIKQSITYPLEEAIW